MKEWIEATWILLGFWLLVPWALFSKFVTGVTL